MVSVSPSSHPPNTGVFDSFSPFTSLSHPFAPPHSISWNLDTFCKALHSARTDSSQCGILSVQHRHYVPGYQGIFEHEVLILDVVPLVPGRGLPQKNAPHTYIQVGRFEDQARMSFFGLSGFARDEVVVVGQKGVQGSNQQVPQFAGYHLTTISWAKELPNLVDVFDVINLFSHMFPRYNVLTCQCFWLPRMIYNLLRLVYDPFHEDTGGLVWMLLPFLTPAPPAVLLSFCRDKKQWSHCATVGRICDSAAERANNQESG